MLGLALLSPLIVPRLRTLRAVGASAVSLGETPISDETLGATQAPTSPDVVVNDAAPLLPPSLPDSETDGQTNGRTDGEGVVSEMGADPAETVPCPVVNADHAPESPVDDGLGEQATTPEDSAHDAETPEG